MENKGIVFFFPHSESRPVFIIYNDKLYKIKSGQIENVRIVKIPSKFETYKKELINEILEKELNKEFGIFEYDKINKRFFLQLEKKTVKVKIGNETFNDILLKNVNHITSGVIGNSVKIIIENMFGEVC